MKAPEIRPADPVLMESVVSALGTTRLHEARMRAVDGIAVGMASIGDVLQIESKASATGKATIVIKDITIGWGLGDPVTRIKYDYKIDDKKGTAEMDFKQFLKYIKAE